MESQKFRPTSSVIILEYFKYNRTDFEKDSELEMICYRLLTFYEGLARGIRQGVYDEEVIKVARRQTMIRTYERFKPYIDNRRKGVHPVAFTQFELIVNKWRRDNIHEGEHQPTDANS